MWDSKPKGILSDLEDCIVGSNSIASENVSAAEISLLYETILVIGRWLGNETRIRSLVNSSLGSNVIFGEQLSEQLIRDGGIPLPIFTEWWLAEEKFSVIDSFIHGCNGLSVKYQVNKLMEMLEATFIKHFANGNRSKGTTILRPKAKREKHRVTFSLGFFSGCTAALLVALILIISSRRIIGERGSTEYMETVFRHYSFFGYIVLHLFMFAVNIYYWRCYGINYSFIFDFEQGRHLGYREVLLISKGLAALALATVVGNLNMDIDKKVKDYKIIMEVPPLILLIVQAIRNFEFYICYYSWGNREKREHRCKGEDVHDTFNYIVATIPYWWRFLQCIRRLVEEGDKMQGYNALKYFSTIVALCMRKAYIMSDAIEWLILAWIFSVISAIISTYWDIFIDWGLLQRDSRNRWLRDKLLVPHKSVYFSSIALNVLLKFAWLQTVMKFRVSFLHDQVQIAIVACLEIIRRGIWNFFRLENEHLNNVGNYRAFKSIPLPFSYSEEEDDKED